jgi:acetyltransferase-like isoleucine patch superfamily enzyme
MALDASVFIHEKALCESDDIGAGTRVWAFAHVMKGAKIGRGCNICDHVFVETGASIGDHVTVKNNVLLWDKVVVEDDVFLGPNAVFTNDRVPRAAFKNSADLFLPTLVRRGATIGANATIVCGVTVGEQAFVGAGAVVIKDIPAHALVVGNPARQVGWLCECGEKLSEELRCGCGRGYRLVSATDGLVSR